MDSTTPARNLIRTKKSSRLATAYGTSISADRDLIGCANRHFQGMIQIGYEIFQVFNSNRQPHQLFGHSHLGPMFGRNHGMRCEHRNRYQRLGPSKARSQGKQLQGLADALGVFTAAFDFEAQYTATALHLLQRQGALGMTFEEWVVHGADFRMRREEFGNA